MMPATMKIALVTGAGPGMGQGMALTMAARGYHIVVTYQNCVSEVAYVADEARKLGQVAVALQLNIGRPDTYGQFLTAFKRVLCNTFKAGEFHYLVNNSAIEAGDLPGEFSEAGLENMLALRCRYIFRFTQKILPLLSSSGAVMNISYQPVALLTQPANGLVSA